MRFPSAWKFGVFRLVLLTAVGHSSFCLRALAEVTPDRQTDLRSQMARVTIPRVERQPRLEDFLEMQPSEDWNGKLARLEGFVQRSPDFGQPASQRTVVYLGYDSQNLYVVFVAFDSQREEIRAYLERRGDVRDDEDEVGIYLDTFHDQRRAYQFGTNALGIQFDTTYSDDTGVIDGSFDTVWYSRGKLTAQGFVVWMSIPFKSLRFRNTPAQSWGILVWRWLPRRSEGSFWPRTTTQILGQLSQSATATGIEGISPGRNLQFIPYGTWRAFRAPDTRNPILPAYAERRAEVNVGLDAKIVLRDSLVLDLTVNPDFSQVESDEPQSVVNERFEVLFPEKRPFFTENANYFEVPTTVANTTLLFTRRIADPQFGARLTGKLGRYSVGALFADDESPGKGVPRGDPLEGKRAYFSVFRLSRDLPRQSNIGTMYTERRFNGSYNRVVALDGTFRLNKTWSATALGVNSWTKSLSGSTASGLDFETRLRRRGRGFNFELRYIDRSPEFLTQAGFFRRNDLRTISQDTSYTFWPQSRWLSNIKAELYTDKGWDKTGTSLYWSANPSLTLELRQPTTFKIYYVKWNDVLRPKDFSALSRNQSYDEHALGMSASSSYLRFVSVRVVLEKGAWLNYVPPAGRPPSLADITYGELGVALRRSSGLTVDNSYILLRLLDRGSGHAIYNSHIIRSKWNWQISRELSIRFIGQYDALLANPASTSAQTKRNFNADFLFTYLLHPGTAVYIGYNSNLRRPGWEVDGPAEDRFVNDGRQLFFKISYLFRF